MGEHDRQEDQDSYSALKEREGGGEQGGCLRRCRIQREGRLPRCAGLPYAHQRNTGILPGMQEGAAGHHRLLHEIKKS